MKTLLDDLIDQQSLTKERAHAMLVAMASGQINLSQMASFLTVYMMRSITVQELQGFRDAMLELCVPVLFDRPVMDVCGTGGDGKNTFNISTLSSFIVAAAGQPVAKHGNYAVSSSCGSSNVLEYFGYKFSDNPDVLRRSIDRANICFMHAPLFHPAIKNVAPIRKELGVKTFFNMLGPMVNPAFPQKQLVGVFNLELARQYAYLFQDTDKEFMVVHSLDGYDEISLTGPFKYFCNKGELLADPSDLFLPTLAAADLRGGESISESAEIFINVLAGQGTPQQSIAVIANAGMALYCANQADGFESSIMKAKDVLESGKAFACFKNLIALS
jgi:anthranilate phosphoribosyltransferase